MKNNPYILNGRTQFLREWAREYNIPFSTVRTRIESGMELKEALTAARQGTGYRIPGGYGIIAAWRQWIMAPVLYTELSTSDTPVK